jgi:hypothetical protein
VIPVTCAIVDGLLQVVVIGDYDFEEVKRAISAAVDHAESDSVRAMVYDVRSAIGQTFANEVRIGADWIGGCPRAVWAPGRSSADTERADQLRTLALGPLERDPGEGRRADVRLDQDSITSELMATLLCTCGHRRETHRYETRRKAWTVCRVCRCVRFTAQGADERKLISRRD